MFKMHKCRKPRAKKLNNEEEGADLAVFEAFDAAPSSDAFDLDLPAPSSSSSAPSVSNPAHDPMLPHSSDHVSLVSLVGEMLLAGKSAASERRRSGQPPLSELQQLLLSFKHNVLGSVSDTTADKILHFFSLLRSDTRFGGALLPMSFSDIPLPIPTTTTWQHSADISLEYTDLTGIVALMFSNADFWPHYFFVTGGSQDPSDIDHSLPYRSQQAAVTLDYPNDIYFPLLLFVDSARWSKANGGRKGHPCIVWPACLPRHVRRMVRSKYIAFHLHNNTPLQSAFRVIGPLLQHFENGVPLRGCDGVVKIVHIVLLAVITDIRDANPVAGVYNISCRLCISDASDVDSFEARTNASQRQLAKTLIHYNTYRHSLRLAREEAQRTQTAIEIPGLHCLRYFDVVDGFPYPRGHTYYLGIVTKHLSHLVSELLRYGEDASQMSVTMMTIVSSFGWSDESSRVYNDKWTDRAVGEKQKV